MRKVSYYQVRTLCINGHDSQLGYRIKFFVNIPLYAMMRKIYTNVLLIKSIIKGLVPGNLPFNRFSYAENTLMFCDVRNVTVFVHDHLHNIFGPAKFGRKLVR